MVIGDVCKPKKLQPRSITTYPHPAPKHSAAASMALVTVSGYPCSGKSTRAEELKAWVEEKIAADKQAAGADGTPKFDNVVLVSDGGVHVTRAAYDGE